MPNTQGAVTMLFSLRGASLDVTKGKYGQIQWLPDHGLVAKSSGTIGSEQLLSIRDARCRRAFSLKNNSYEIIPSYRGGENLTRSARSNESIIY